MPAADSCRVVALAGRRVDPPGAKAERFPPRQVPAVRERVRDWLSRKPTAALVSSAACGADLIALSAAAMLGIRSRIVLPFEPTRFRNTSVVDRPGDWGEAYDRAIGEASGRGDLVVLSGVGEGSAAYAAVNDAIVREATALASSLGCGREAAIVWDGRPRGENDLTAGFARGARAAGFAVEELPTMGATGRSETRPMT